MTMPYSTRLVDIDATKGPYVTWGTNPGQGLPITASVPEPDKIADATAPPPNAITYMGLARHADQDIAVDTVFIGSAPTVVSTICARPPRS